MKGLYLNIALNIADKSFCKRWGVNQNRLHAKIKKASVSKRLVGDGPAIDRILRLIAYNTNPQREEEIFNNFFKSKYEKATL